MEATTPAVGVLATHTGDTMNIFSLSSRRPCWRAFQQPPYDRIPTYNNYILRLLNTNMSAFREIYKNPKINLETKALE